MIRKLANWLINFLVKPNKKSWMISLVIFIAIVSPLAITDYFGYKATEKHLTELTISRRESLAHLATIALHEKFDRIVDLGISFATRVQFRKFVEAGKWDEAIKILERAPKDFPYIDTVGLFDTSGTVWAITPPIPEAVGQNFSYRDYYKGVSKNWKPYVSEVFKRAPEPRYHVVSVAIPIKSDAPTGSDPRILGILLLTINLDTVLDWAREIEVGAGGFVYFVDRNGHAVEHPKFSSQSDVVDFSEVSIVKKVLKGEKGVEINYNQVEEEERISAYEPVPEYGWGVIVQQPTQTAFAQREASLQSRLIKDGITLAAAALLAYFILIFISSLNSYRQKERIFLESVGDGLAAIDRHWNITLWNEAANRLTGWKREEVLGKPFRDFVKFVREYDRKENITFIEETMLFGKSHQMENNTLLIRRDGKEIYVGDSAAPIFDQKGQVDGAIIVFRDISQERELEKAREEFASFANHQLRTPPTVIRGYLSMLLDESTEPLTKAQKENLKAIEQANERMLTLVNALLAASRIESGALAINPESAYLPDLAEKALNEFMPQIASKKLKLNKKFDANLPNVGVDLKLMNAIWQNLISNAIKYTPEGGSIDVEITRKEQDILLKVADTGMGIPKEQQSKMFTKMFRADNARVKDPDGAGLGLYIAKSIIEAAGGKIWFESPARRSPRLAEAIGEAQVGAGGEENKGTAFFIALPLSGMKKREGTKGLQ